MELRRMFRACPDLTDEQKREVTQLVDRLVNKFMHPCVSTLRRHAASSLVLASELHAAAAKVRKEQPDNRSIAEKRNGWEQQS